MNCAQSENLVRRILFRGHDLDMAILVLELGRCSLEFRIDLLWR